jgi:recombination protein RecA
MAEQQKRTRKTDTQQEKLSDQVEKKVSKKEEKEEGASFKPYEGNFEQMISTGSTLFDLAISGGRVRGGGIPSGIIMELSALPSMGKSATLCEIGGDVERKGGETKPMDPEGRLSSTFAQIFDYNLPQDQIEMPETPFDVFNIMREWKPKDKNKINCILVDSSAALVSDLELENKKDEYSRRSKLFSQELRKSARPIKKNNYLMVFSNQLRENVGALPGQDKYYTPGGQAFDFYASLRVRYTKMKNHEMKHEETIAGKKVEETIGIKVQAKIFKSSVWKPYRTAPLYIIFDYGIDDIRANLEYYKKYTGATMFYAGKKKLHQGIEDSIRKVEEEGLEEQLREAVIDLWEEIDKKFQTNRKKKKR